MVHDISAENSRNKQFKELQRYKSIKMIRGWVILTVVSNFITSLGKFLLDYNQLGKYFITELIQKVISLIWLLNHTHKIITATFHMSLYFRKRHYISALVIESFRVYKGGIESPEQINCRTFNFECMTKLFNVRVAHSITNISLNVRTLAITWKISRAGLKYFKCFKIETFHLKYLILKHF